MLLRSNFTRLKRYGIETVHRVIFNGRFLHAPQTGVQRVARELIFAFMECLNESDDIRSNLSAKLIYPNGESTKSPHKDLGTAQFGRFSGHLWEQFELPRAATGQLLVNLCNISPMWAKNSITMIHDAQVFSSRESYSKLFGAWYRFVLPQIGRTARRILTVSQYSADQLSARGIAPPHKISVIHNGVDHILRQNPDERVLEKLDLQPRQYSVGLANTQAHKNIQVLAEAFANPVLANHKLVLFGSADLAKFNAAGIALPKNTVLAGRLDDSELRAIIGSASALLFPSKTEGFGLPPLEAMILGTPAICSRAGALPEVCGNAASLLDPDSSADWAKEIVTVWQEAEEERKVRSERGRAHAEQYTWFRAGQKLLDIISEDLSLPKPM